MSRSSYSSRYLLLTVFPLTVFLTSLQTLWAVDIINRKGTERRVSGEITEMTRAEVTVTPLVGAAVIVPVSDISSIEFDSKPKELNVTEGLIINNQFADAREQYQAALDQSKAGSFIRQEIEFLIARSFALEGMEDPSKLEAAISAMETFLATHRNFYRYDEALVMQAKLLSQSAQPERVEALFPLLISSPFKASQLQADLIKAETLIRQQQYQPALTALDQLLTATNGNAELADVHRSALASKIVALAKLERPQQALELLTQALASLDDSQPDVLARLYVQKGEMQELSGNVDDAILSYLMVDLVLASQMGKKDSTLHAQALYHLSRLWPLAGHPERGTQAASTLQSTYPSSSWTKKLGG